MRLTNPLEYMTGFTRKLQTNSNILISLLHYLLGFGGWLDIGFNEQKKIPLIFYLDPRIFFLKIKSIVSNIASVSSISLLLRLFHCSF